MSRASHRGPRRYRLSYEWQDPKRQYEWRKAFKAFSGPAARDDEVAYLRHLPGIRNVTAIDVPHPVTVGVGRDR